jgi:hypothetical protein
VKLLKLFSLIFSLALLVTATVGQSAQAQSYGDSFRVRPYPPGGGHGGGHGGGGYPQEQQISCESVEYRYQYCPFQNRGHIERVYLRAQQSKTSCIEGQNWGWDRNGVWVNNGCRAIFGIIGGQRSYPITVRCESAEYRTATCGIPLRYVEDVRIGRQLSKSACIEGSSWRSDGYTITVSNGCRAEFLVYGY